MRMAALPLENTSRGVTHPEVIRTPDGGVRHLIEDPMVDRITKGDPTFGWEGDDRYGLYVNQREGRFELWRLENDNVYRCSLNCPGYVKGVEAVAWLVKWIVEHDSRRGHDPVLTVIEHNTRIDSAKAAASTERNAEVADRLHFGLMKDIGHTQVGMTRRQFPVPAMPAAPADPPKELVTP